MNPRVGEVWRWLNEQGHPMYHWDDLWLMLKNDYPNIDAYDALNLETGEVDVVFPAHNKHMWERTL